MNALAHLNTLANQRKRELHSNSSYPVKVHYSDRDANGLTKCIMAYLNLSGHFATRLQSTGTYRANVGKFVPRHQFAGLPDTFSAVNGHAVLIEVKARKDRLSTIRKKTINDLKKAGASVYVAQSFEGFHTWFANFTPHPFA